MTNTIDTIKRVREIMQMDCKNMASFLAAESARTFHYSEAAQAIEHLLGIIKQQHTALSAADAAGQFRGHIGEMAQATMDKAIELSAPYAELVGS